MPARDYTGIERRTDLAGNESCRGYVKERGQKIRGPWTTYAEARGWRFQALATLSDGRSLRAPKSVSLRVASEEFLRGAEQGIIRSRKRVAYAPATLRGYRQAFTDWINPELGDIPVKSLRRSEVQRFVDTLASKRAAGTVRNTWAALAALYLYLLPRHDDLVNPTQGVALPRPGEPRERYAEPEEMARLLSVLPAALALPYALAFYAGLRRAEIQALAVDHVLLTEGWLEIRWALDPKAGFKKLKSDAGERDIPIFSPLRPYLERTVIGTVSPSTPKGPGTLLLPSTRHSKFGAQMLGRPYTSRCQTVWEGEGLEHIGLHEARHSFATAAIRAGHDVKLVSEWLGHAQASTTLNIYVKRRGRAPGLTEKMDLYLTGAA
jgi:integrase